MLNLENKAKEIRRNVFETIVHAGKGHIGGSFSCIEILTALYYGGVLKVDTTKKIDRDIFILSKGHACAVLYIILADLGFFPHNELESYAREGSIFEAHVTNSVPGVEVSTGSLGMGVGIGSGIALADKLDNRNRKVVVLMGDGECQEGSVWESAMFAAQHKLSNLLVIVDRNNQAVLDFLPNYNDVEPFADKWRAFGWDTWETDGHDVKGMTFLLNHIYNLANAGQLTKPTCVIANTIKGKGVSFMERIPVWHHKFPNKDEIEQARKELT